MGIIYTKKMSEELIKKRISLIQKILEIARKILGLQSKLEKIQLEEMIRKIAKEEGVDEEVLLAVIKCESGLDTRAINKNPNGTTDYGLCQFNDYWYWEKEKIINPITALNNPEMAVRIMAKMFKAGRAKDWICYKNAIYLKYLKIN